MEAFMKPVSVTDSVGRNQIKVERSLQQAKLRARSLSIDKHRRPIFSPEHVQRWRGHKYGPVIDSEP